MSRLEELEKALAAQCEVNASLQGELAQKYEAIYRLEDKVEQADARAVEWAKIAGEAHGRLRMLQARLVEIARVLVGEPKP